MNRVQKIQSGDSICACFLLSLLLLFNTTSIVSGYTIPSNERAIPDRDYTIRSKQNLKEKATVTNRPWRIAENLTETDPLT
jgi:hypothetical protein